MTGNDQLAAQLAEDYAQAEITTAEKAMLDYAVKLTKEPWKMTKEDMTPLREVGFSDRAILDMNQVTGYYAYVNRLADGLGVQLEDFWEAKENNQA